jgi:ribosomal protein S27E
MTTAIVTITCPSCGGKIEGITATNADQTIKCTYCGTELHVPRVGEVIHEVVHEVIREVPSQPTLYLPPDEDIRPKQSPFGAIVGVSVLAVVAVAVMCNYAKQSSDVEDQAAARKKAAELDRQNQQTCEKTCKDSCANAGEGSDTGLDDPKLDEQMRDVYRNGCELKCKHEKNCSGMGY